MKHEPKRHFDISKPRRHAPDPTSKPIIVGHHPTMPDPMIRGEAAKAPRPISVTDGGIGSAPVSINQTHAAHPPEEPKIPDLSDLSAPQPTTNPVSTPSVGPSTTPTNPDPAMPQPQQQPAAPEPTPGAVFAPAATPAATPYAPTPEPTQPNLAVPQPTTPRAEPTMPQSHMAVPAAPQPATTPQIPTHPPPPVHDEVHIPAGHDVAVHHKPRLWVWAIFVIMVLAWIYAAVDALTETKLPVEFFKKEAKITEQTPVTQPTPQPTPTPPPVASTFELPDGWKYYENKELGFKFAHPEKWDELEFGKEENQRTTGSFSNETGEGDRFPDSLIIKLHKKTMKHLDTDSPTLNIYGYKETNGRFTLLRAEGGDDPLASNDVLASSITTNRSYLLYGGKALGYYVTGFGKLENSNDYDAVIFDYIKGREDNPYTKNDSAVKQITDILESFQNI